MDELRVLIAFAALLALACTYISLGVKSALAPLCAVATAALWFSLWGGLGLLRLGGLLFYALAAACLFFVLGRHLIFKKAFPLPGTGFWFFVVASALIIALLWLRQPLFTTWDEFSFWGTAGKLVKTTDELYTTATIGWGWPATQSPALVVFSYFFQFFGTGFLPWQTYAACDVLQFAAIAALLAPFERKHWPAALPAMLTAVLTPYVFVHYSGIQKVSQVYLDSLADIPMGLLFGAALACAFCWRKGLSGAVPLCLTLALLTLTKEISILLALVVGGAVFVDVLFRHKSSAEWPALQPAGATLSLSPRAQKIPFLQRLKYAALRGGPALATPVAAYALWSLHLSLAIGVDRVADAGGKQNISLLEMPFAFLRQLFSPEKDPFFTEVTSGMSRLFFKEKTTLLGSSLLVILAIFAVLALAFILSRSKAHRRRVLVFAIVGLLGFAAYYFMVLLSYLYLFREDLILIGYERYLYPYLIGWMLAALLLLGRSATEDSGRWAIAANAATLAVSIAFLVLVGRAVPAAYTPLGLHSEEYAPQRAFADEVSVYRSALPDDSLTFLVFSGDDGSGFFRYCYELLPRQVDYSFGGDSIIRRTALDGGGYESHELTAEDWRIYLEETGCTHVLIDGADEAFAQRYGALFEDGLSAYFENDVRLYRIEGTGEALRILPLGSGV